MVCWQSALGAGVFGELVGWLGLVLVRLWHAEKVQTDLSPEKVQTDLCHRMAQGCSEIL